MKLTLFVSFIDNHNTWQLGIPQAFKYELDQLYLLLFLEQFQNQAKLEWIPAKSCNCLGLIDLHLLQDMLKRDKVTLKDLEVIKNFNHKYAEKFL